MNGAPPLGAMQLVAAAALVGCSIGLIRVYRVDLAGAFMWGAVRTVAQLLLVGYVLRWIFATNLPVYVALAFAVMLVAASWTASARVKHPVPGLLVRSGLALAVGAGATTVAVTAFVVRADPWWAPRYVLPLAGMIIGNAMNAAALAGERLQSEIAARQREIEELLALGASPRQAVDGALRAALRAALVPTVNAMLTVGLVSLPGMMTGQMVAGADPEIAARYQIVVMFMLASATTISAVLLATFLYRRFFTAAWQLRTWLLFGE